MTIDTLIMLSGAFVAILPFLGVPTKIDTVLLFAAGVFMIALGIVVRRRGANLNTTRPPMRDPHFVDTEPRAQTVDENPEERNE
jgi:hypothetical protein